MMAKTHQLFGVTFGLIAIFICNLFLFLPESPIEVIIYFMLILFGSILLDLDHPKSRLGSRVPFISYPMYWLFGHRTITHSLIFVMGIVIVSFALVHFFSLSVFYAFGLSIGVVSHILGDYLTNSGVPLLYPIKKDRYKFPITFKTGSAAETGIAFFLLVVNISFFVMFYKQGFFVVG